MAIPLWRNRDVRPVGALLGGVSLEALGAVPTFAALGVWPAAVAAVSTASRRIRRAPRPPESADGGADGVRPRR